MLTTLNRDPFTRYFRQPSGRCSVHPLQQQNGTKLKSNKGRENGMRERESQQRKRLIEIKEFRVQIHSSTNIAAAQMEIYKGGK